MKGRVTLTTVSALFDSARAVEGREQSFSALCPAHGDTRPSLSIRFDAKTRRTLIHCWAGCTNDEIAAALGLRSARDLYAALESETAPGESQR